MRITSAFRKPPFSPCTLMRKRSGFKCLHFEQRFEMYAFSLKTMSVFDRCSVDDGGLKTHQRKRISEDGA